MLFTLKNPIKSFLVMSPELHNLLDRFLFAVVSGGIAGLIAGWVLLRFQLNAQLALDDTPKIIGMVQALQEARIEISIAVMKLEHSRTHKEDFDEHEQQLEVKEKVDAASLLILKLASQAQYLRSKQYRQLRAYLMLRIQRSDAWFEDDADEMLKKIDEWLADINAYVYRKSFLSIIKEAWSTFRDSPSSCFRNRLTREQKELLVAGTRLDAYMSVADEPTPFVHVLPMRAYIGEDAPKYVAAFNWLLENKYLEDTGAALYSLSRKGWKEAIRITKGESEPGLLM